MLIAVKLLRYFLHFYGSAHFVIVTAEGGTWRRQGQGKLILLQRCRLQLGDLTRPDLTLIRVGKQYVDALQLRVTMRVLGRGSQAAERGAGWGAEQLQLLRLISNNRKGQTTICQL